MIDIDKCLSIAGLLATLIFGWLSIGLYNRKKYPGRISFVKLAVLNLLNDIANNFKDIKLLHNNNPIRKNLVYIKGAFLNNGDIDIKTLSGECNITLTLPDDYKWVDFAITSHSEDLSCVISQEAQNKEKISFDVFKKDEFIIFEGLVDTPQKIESKFFEDIIKFNHRIENTAKISVETILSEKSLKSKSFMRRILGFYLIIGLLLGLLALVNRQDAPLRYYNSETPDVEYSAQISKDNKIVLNDVSHDNFFSPVLEIFRSGKVISKEEFTKAYNVSDYITPSVNYFVTCELVLIIIFALFLIIPNYMMTRKTKRINRILQNHS